VVGRSNRLTPTKIKAANSIVYSFSGFLFLNFLSVLFAIFADI